MKVKVLSRDEVQLEDNDFKDALEIHIDGEKKFEVWDGEVEDANLGRDFADCFNIPTLMRLAYEAGKKGEEFSLVNGFLKD